MDGFFELFELEMTTEHLQFVSLFTESVLGYLLLVTYTKSFDEIVFFEHICKALESEI